MHSCRPLTELHDPQAAGPAGCSPHVACPASPRRRGFRLRREQMRLVDDQAWRPAVGVGEVGETPEHQASALQSSRPGRFRLAVEAVMYYPDRQTVDANSVLRLAGCDIELRMLNALAMTECRLET
jgi:hypothetical protein